MATGTISRYWQGRGFGFIKSNISAQDVFLHISAIDDKALLAKMPNIEGTRVTFEIGSRPRGVAALKVRMAP